MNKRVEKSPDKFEEHDEKEMHDLDVIDSWDDKSMDNTDVANLHRDSETEIGSPFAEKNEFGYRHFQKSERLRGDRNYKMFDKRHPRYLHGGRGRGPGRGFRRGFHNKNYRDIRNDKMHKVNNYLTRLDSIDIEDQPPGTELDSDIEYVLKKREEERRRNMRFYKSRSRSLSRDRERHRRSSSREYRRKRFTPPKLNKYPNSDYERSNSSRGSVRSLSPGVSHNFKDAPHDVPHSETPLMPTYYSDIEYQPHYAQPVPQSVPFQPITYPIIHDSLSLPQIPYNAPYIPPPVVEPLSYPSPFPLRNDTPLPIINHHSVSEPSPQEALDNMLLEGKISMQDYSKLTTKSASGPIENVKYHELNLHNKANVLLRCHDAVLKLEGLRLPNRLFVPPDVEAIPTSEVKYSSPLKRNPIQYSFTSAACERNMQNKLLISKIIHTLGLQKVNLKKPKKKVSIREISTQTISVDCYTCKIRQMTKNVSIEIQVDRADFTKSCHSQVIDQELASSKMVFGHGANAASAPISLTHLTPAQIVSSLASKAKMLQSHSQLNEPEDNYYNRFHPDNSSSYHQGHYGNKNRNYNPPSGSNAPYQDSYNQHRPYWGRNN